MAKRLQAVFAVIDGAMYEVLEGSDCFQCAFGPGGCSNECNCIKGADRAFVSNVRFKRLTPPKVGASSESVGNKYTILDAATGKIKSGKYFVLKIDAKDPEERVAVRLALQAYSVEQDRIGRFEYAGNVLGFIGEGK